MTAPDGTGSERRAFERHARGKRETGASGLGEEKDKEKNKKTRPA